MKLLSGLTVYKKPDQGDMREASQVSREGLASCTHILLFSQCSRPMIYFSAVSFDLRAFCSWLWHAIKATIVLAVAISAGHFPASARLTVVNADQIATQAGACPASIVTK